MGEASVRRTRLFHRGSGDGTHGTELMRNKGSLPERSAAWLAVEQRRTREGPSRLGQMTDGLVVPVKPGNAGGGKGS
jgi:hypothetical protein